ncbi:MAG: thermonuclease family protein [Acidimicrobiales bacterium]|nr:thermonuclease family protein [Acidimicrobiales bacterium]
MPHVAAVATVAASLVAVTAATGCAPPDPTAPGSSLAPVGTVHTAVVVAPVDGDTVRVRLGGSDETVRLIGIDTPETKRPGTPVECYGPEAAARLDALAPPGTVVLVEADAEPRDRYGRTLAHLHRAADGTYLNEAMVAEGFAAPLRIEPNVAHAERLAEAADAARAGGVGLWSACGGPHELVR